MLLHDGIVEELGVLRQLEILEADAHLEDRFRRQRRARVRLAHLVELGRGLLPSRLRQVALRDPERGSVEVLFETLVLFGAERELAEQLARPLRLALRDHLLRLAEQRRRIAEQALLLLRLLYSTLLLLFGLRQVRRLLAEAHLQVALQLGNVGLDVRDALRERLDVALHAAHFLEHLFQLHAQIGVVAAGDLGELRHLLGHRGQLLRLILLHLLELRHRLLQRRHLRLQRVDLVVETLAVLLRVVRARRQEQDRERTDLLHGHPHRSMNSARRFSAHASSSEPLDLGSFSPLLTISILPSDTPSRAKYFRTSRARRSPSARLYSSVPRSSQWPSIVTRPPFTLRHSATACRPLFTSEVSVASLNGKRTGG